MHDRRHQVALRGRCRRRGRVRHLPDQAAGRSRGGCAGAGCRPRSRRNLVLEPLPRRAFRFRKLHLRLFVLEGAAQRVALEGAVLGAAGEPALPQLRRRQVRSSQIHAVQPQGRVGRLRRGQRSVAAQARRWPRVDLPVRRSDNRVAVDADAAAAGRHGRLSRAVRSTRSTGRTSRSNSPARRSASSAPAPPPSR